MVQVNKTIRGSTVVKLQLLGIPQSTFVWTVRMALHEKGVDYDLLPEPPHSDAVRAIHPLGRIPAIRHSDVALAESRAIVTYIDGAFDGPHLARSNVKEAARDEMWVSMALTAFDTALIRKHFFAYFMPGTADGKPDPKRVEEAIEGSKRACAALERGVEAGEVLGATRGLADLWIIPQLHYARTLPDWDTITAETPSLKRAATRALSWDVVNATMPPPLPSTETVDA